MSCRLRIVLGLPAVAGIFLLWGCPQSGGGGGGGEEDLCAGIECGAGEQCDPATGACQPTDDGGGAGDDGEEDLCAGVQCAAGELCNPATGECETGDDGGGGGGGEGGEYYATDRPRLNGVTYYVAPDGDDSSPGTLESPWATIQYAAEMMEPGNLVYIRGGVYHESVVTSGSGTSAGDVVFAAYSDERPIIDGTGVDANNGFIIVDDYVVLRGLVIRNWPENAVWIESAAFPYLIDCEVHDVGYGVGATEGTHDFVFDHVTAHNFDLYGFDVSPGDSDCYKGVFWHCVAHTGRDPDQNVDGFALGHGTQRGFLFHQCHTYGVFDGFDVSSRDTVLERCSAHHCGNAGFKVWQDNVRLVNCLSYENENANLELDWDGDSGTVTVQNCTFVGSDVANIWVENSGDTLRMYNTIVAGGRHTGLVFEQQNANRYEGDYNLFHHETDRAFVVGYEDEFSAQGLDAWRAYSGDDAHSLAAEFLANVFVDAAGSDFHLTADCPGLDHGSSEDAPSEDYDGIARPQGSGVDVGAFERSRAARCDAVNRRIYSKAATASRIARVVPGSPSL